ncbi:MAG: FadR/GntR family transcriptional regulator [Anaerolineales bacterium]
MLADKLDSDLLRYIVEHNHQPGDRLKSSEELSAEMGVSIGKLREQLEGARVLGLVDVKPHRGIRLNEYSFLPAVRASLMYALASGQAHFEAFGALRTHLEAAYWHEAVSRLTPDDHAYLRDLIQRAHAKLNGRPIQIPHGEHRDLHLAIFGRLDNPFVIGLLEAYWDAYEAVGLSRYSDYSYLQEVWNYHARIVQAIEAGDSELGYQLLKQHTDLLSQRQSPDGTPVDAPEGGMASIG